MFADPQMIAQIKEMGLEPVASSPLEFTQFLKVDAVRWRKLITEAGLATAPADQ
jgi:tripartite-type tricarboxylate transporter receptor subunit TctC